MMEQIEIEFGCSLPYFGIFSLTNGNSMFKY